jgi:hypothetical protein
MRIVIGDDDGGAFAGQMRAAAHIRTQHKSEDRPDQKEEEGAAQETRHVTRPWKKK